MAVDGVLGKLSKGAADKRNPDDFALWKATHEPKREWGACLHAGQHRQSHHLPQAPLKEHCGGRGGVERDVPGPASHDKPNVI
jgi:hypothetical protein